MIGAGVGDAPLQPLLLLAFLGAPSSRACNPKARAAIRNSFSRRDRGRIFSKTSSSDVAAMRRRCRRRSPESRFGRDGSVHRHRDRSMAAVLC